MAADPAFGSTPLVGAALLGAAETSLTVPTTTSTLITATGSGFILDEIAINAATTSLAPAIVAGLVYIFIFDGSTSHLYDTLSIPLPASTASSTIPPLHLSRRYNLSIPATYTIRASQSIAGNASLLKVTALGATL